MLRRTLGVLFAGWVTVPAHTLAGTGLPADVQAALQQAHVPPQALVAVVRDATGGPPRLAWQPRLAVNPASLMKLVTTGAAFDLLGPAWTWTTPVWLAGPVRNPGPDGVLDGNLVIKGSGDPKLVIERLWLLLRRVQQAGVHDIRGDIVLDRSAFHVPEQSPGEFDGEPLRPYNVHPDALLLNYKSVLLTFTPDAQRDLAGIAVEPALAGVRADAAVPLSPGPCDDWRAALKADFSDPSRLRFTGGYPAACGEKVWPVAFADPARYNARALAGLWAEMGGRLGGQVRDGTAPAATPSFEIVSPTLAELVRDMNKFSNNVMAQQLFLTLALVQRGSGTPEAAREVLNGWLTDRFGVDARDAVIDNGSGLSRDTRLSAELLARLLLWAYASPAMPELMSSLPLTGIDGTMKRSRAPAGRAHVKTGSLQNVTGIAGYVLGDSGRQHVVVAIVNHPNAAAAKPALDLLLQWAMHDAPASASGDEADAAKAP